MTLIKLLFSESNEDFKVGEFLMEKDIENSEKIKKFFSWLGNVKLDTAEQIKFEQGIDLERI